MSTENQPATSTPRKEKQYIRKPADILLDMEAELGSLHEVGKFLGTHPATPAQWQKAEEMPAVAHAACSYYLRSQALLQRLAAKVKSTLIIQGTESEVQPLKLLAQQMNLNHNLIAPTS